MDVAHVTDKETEVQEALCGVQEVRSGEGPQPDVWWVTVSTLSRPDSWEAHRMPGGLGPS